MPTAAELKGNNYLEADGNVTSDYIVNGKVVLRPKLPANASSTTFTVNEAFTVTNIPAGTTLIHPDGVDIINDGELEWSCTIPGIYTLTLRKFPYLDEAFNVEVKAQS